MSYKRFLWLFAYVQHILCCVFLRILCPVLPDSLDYPFLITPSLTLFLCNILAAKRQFRN
jgi:hypothetical protein